MTEKGLIGFVAAAAGGGAPSAILANTKLPIPASAFPEAAQAPPLAATHDGAYWAAKTAGFDFRGEDRVDADELNRIVWEGLGTHPTPRNVECRRTDNLNQRPGRRTHRCGLFKRQTDVPIGNRQSRHHTRDPRGE